MRFGNIYTEYNNCNKLEIQYTVEDKCNVGQIIIYLMLYDTSIDR